MKVSICIPCYKQVEYLPEAIDSALVQTYEDVEILIVNDGSPDATAEIAHKYQLAHPFKVKVIHQVNKGLASARNSAVMNATGDYFLPLDADDLLMPNCVERLVQTAKETGADVTAPSFQAFGERSETIILMPNPTTKDFLVGNRVGYFSMIKMDVIKQVGGYSPKMIEGYEDLHLWFNLLTQGKIFVTVPEVLVLYRTKFRSMWKEAIKHHDKLMKQIYTDFPQVLPREL